MAIKNFAIKENFKCDNCNNGIVTVVRKKSGNNYSVKVGECNVCEKSFGFKSIATLSEIKKTPA